jgi:hypothetical protein
MTDNAHLAALDAFVDARPMLDFANYGDVPAYRADQRANMRDRADYWVIRRIGGSPSIAALEDAARGSRLRFFSEFGGSNAAIDYTAGQYYPREYRAACVRLLASCWWHAQAAARPDWTAEDIRAQARRMFGRSIARRWFS